MSEPTFAVRPVQIKLAVTDEAAAVAFYTRAFGLQYQVTRRAGAESFSSFMFGQPGQDGFFLLHLLNDPQDYDRPGTTTFGLLVPDLDAAHRRAVEAGGVEVVPPNSPEGMPRCSAVRDPSGNWVWLYQA
jgi:predicted enzyme related to lactoylglutathione lyase